MRQNFSRRGLELALLLPMSAVLALGFFLLFQSKLLTATLPANAVNINQATAPQLVKRLGLPAILAQQIVDERQKLRGHAFGSTSQMRHLKPLAASGVDLDDDLLIVRSKAGGASEYWQGVGFFFLAFLLAHIYLRKTAPSADPFLLPLIEILCGVGLMMVYTVKDPFRDTFSFLGQIRGVALYGMIALAIPLLKPFSRIVLRRYQYVYAVAAIVLMVLQILVGSGPGGVHLQLFGFEPVEVIKILLVLFVVSYLTQRPDALDSPINPLPRVQDFGPLAIIYASVLLLFVAMKDLGPAVLLFGTFLTIVYLATQRKIYPLVGGSLLLIAGFIGYKIHLGFFATRVTMWLNPWENTDAKGAQLGQGLWGMATGGIFGSGLGMGNPGMIPRGGSDLIFASIGEEMGLIGAICILIVYVLICVRGFRIALQAVTHFDRLLAAGLTTLLTLQTMIIVGGVTGFLPLTGITLPFVSFGTSSLVVNFFSIGLLLHLSSKTLPNDVTDVASSAWARSARIVTVAMAAYLLIEIGVFRLFYIQGIADTSIASRAIRTPDRDLVTRDHVNPRLRIYANAIPRGTIYDRNGRVLAVSATSEQMSQATGLLNPDGRMRVYPGGPACAHLIYAVEGDRSPTNALGRNGDLRGYASYADLLTAYRLRYLPGAPRPKGEDVHLSIDLDLQQAASRALLDSAHSVHDRRTGKSKDSGAAVAIDVATGEVLAAVTAPTFDPATVTGAGMAQLLADKDKRATLVNRAVRGLYPPGSTFKVVTAAAAFEQGLQSTIVNCPHTEYNVKWRYNGVRYARRRITDDSEFSAHGSTDMPEALAVSCNIYFAHLGLQIGPEALEKTATEGFGLAYFPKLKALGEDLPDCSYGQGTVRTTPTEMAEVAQTVANGGIHIPARFFHDASTQAHATTVLTVDQAAQLQAMLAGVVTGGTARGVFNGLPVSVAGKTGSAQNDQGDKQTHSWFIGSAPADHPSVAFSCVIENGGHGRSAAGPVCRAIVSQVFSPQGSSSKH
ncbi:MAG: FtsW/RodA/SpoVE family cell cycle protein [Capsulimonas sp.]|uniref:FtsW/RodA/SpoVE family cell cycle protein n=2 Tax=Capsulimonas sp. TaxID=2494211 RepID=UPI0032631F5E